MLVVIACMYNQGCEEAAHALYKSSPTYQAQVDYMEAKAEDRLGKRTISVVGSSGLFLANRAWTYKITDNFLIKGDKQWSTLSLSYQYYF